MKNNMRTGMAGRQEMQNIIKYIVLFKNKGENL